MSVSWQGVMTQQAMVAQQCFCLSQHKNTYIPAQKINKPHYLRYYSLTYTYIETIYVKAIFGKKP